MSKNLLFFFSLFVALTSFAQVTFIVNEFPENTSEVNEIYISGDFEGWSGGREELRLKEDKNIFSITIPNYKEAINFKFTQGSWDTAETKEDGSNIENRTYSFNKPNDTVYVSIEKWASVSDLNKPKPSTAEKNVYVFSENFKIPQLNRTRRISIYLPPNYNATSKRYPVLYLLDGQNIFDNATSYSGEWEVDEQLNALHKQMQMDFIAVAINHGNEYRITEYSAYYNAKYGRGEGEVFLDFIINNVKPEVDKYCRTKPDSENTTIIGSSMGGLFAHFAAIKRPDIFGKAMVFSPSFWYSDACYIFTNENIEAVRNSKFYFLVGDKEGETMVDNVNKMVTLMLGNNVPENHIYKTIIPNGTHNESLWRHEFKPALMWLFMKE